MLLELLTAVYFVEVAFDAWLTRKRIKRYGPNVELNGLVRWAATHMGPELAAMLFVIGPAFGWAYLFWAFDFPVGLALLVGWKGKLFNIQLASLEFEKQATELAKLINSRGKASDDATLPSDELTSKSEASSSKDKSDAQ